MLTAKSGNRLIGYVGAYLVIQKLIMETMIDKIVKSIYNDDRGSGLFLDLASYFLVTENNAGQYYPDYAYNHPLFTPDNRIYSDSTVSKFIREISVEDSVTFQNEWNAIKKKTQKLPNSEIEKALRLKEEYYGTKGNL